MVEPLLKEVFGGKDHEVEGGFTEVEPEEEVLEIQPVARRLPKVQPQGEDIGKEPPSTSVMAKAGPFLAAGHGVPSSDVPKSTSLSHHYSWATLIKTTST